MDRVTLRSMRVLSGLSQSEMASMLRLSQASLSRVEKGKQKISKKLEQRIREILENNNEESDQDGK